LPRRPKIVSAPLLAVSPMNRSLPSPAMPLSMMTPRAIAMMY